MRADADSRIRTRDLPLTRRLLYQLSYVGAPYLFAPGMEVPEAKRLSS